jgi:hypothetical protein
VRGAQVLVTGESGLGKTQLARRVVHEEKIALNERLPLQAWLLGSSDDLFRRQLVAFFESWLPVVVQGCENKQEEALQCISAWLGKTDDWLLVIDNYSAEACPAVAKYIPRGLGRGGAGGSPDLSARGCVLFTSIEPLDAWREQLGLTAVLRPAMLTVEQCKQVFSEMDVFGREANKAAKAALAELQALTEGRK